MTRRLFAAIAFLTRAPLPAHWQFDAADVGRATPLFPLVGAGLGAVGAALLTLLAKAQLPPMLAAALLVALAAWLTGALHLDGLADTADGFGGGRSREDVLRIMRDHCVGTYGALALILLVLVKVIAVAALVERGAAWPYLILAPALGRWTTVTLSFLLPYARKEGGLGAAVTDHVGSAELAGTTVVAVAVTLLTVGPRGAWCWLAVFVVTACSARLCRRKIGGVTGDTLGANTEVCEAAVFVLAVTLTR